jgi:hypothetical protein
MSLRDVRERTRSILLRSHKVCACDQSLGQSFRDSKHLRETVLKALKRHGSLSKKSTSTRAASLLTYN